MEYIVFFIKELLFNYISYFTMIYFSNIFLNRSKISFKSHFIWTSSYTFFAAMFYFYNIIQGNNIYPEFISIIFFLVYIGLFYHNSLLEKIFAILSLFLLMYLIEIIVQYIIIIFYGSITLNTYFEVSLLALRLLLICLHYISSLRKSNIYKLEKLPNSQLYFLILILLISFFYAFLFDLTGLDSDYNNIFKLISMLVLSILSFGSITIVGRYNNEKLLEYKNRLSSEQLNLQLNHYNNLESSLEETRRIKHDMKNHIICLKYLASKGEYETLNSYIDDIETSINNINTGIYTGNNVIDAIINQKMVIAKENNIKFNINASLPVEPFIQSIDICTVVSNSIDNAIEACIKLDNSIEKTIELESHINQNHWIYKLKNTSEKVVISKKTNLIETSKEDKINHGLGLKNIYQSANKYDGLVNISFDKNNFIFAINIPIILKK